MYWLPLNLRLVPTESEMLNLSRLNSLRLPLNRIALPVRIRQAYTRICILPVRSKELELPFPWIMSDICVSGRFHRIKLTLSVSPIAPLDCSTCLWPWPKLFAISFTMVIQIAQILSPRLFKPVIAQILWKVKISSLSLPEELTTLRGFHQTRLGSSQYRTYEGDPTTIDPPFLCTSEAYFQLHRRFPCCIENRIR